MGLMMKDLIPDKTYWVISDPHTDIPFFLPKKATFKSYEHVEEDNRIWDGFGSYMMTMVFTDEIRIPLHDSGMKCGFKATRGYYVSENSAHLFDVMTRLAYPEKFDIRPQDDFDYEWFRRLIHHYEKEHPELLI